MLAQGVAQQVVLLERVELRMAAERRSRSIRRYRYELGELVEIARALTQERDTDRLLDLILEKSRFITGAGAGSIYVVEEPQIYSTLDMARLLPTFETYQDEAEAIRSFGPD